MCGEHMRLQMREQIVRGAETPISWDTILIGHPGCHRIGITLEANGKLRGRARHIPFARTAKHIAVLAKRDGAPVVALVAAEGLAIREGTSLAGEPQDTVTFDGAAAISSAPAPAGLDAMALSRLGAPSASWNS